MKIWGIGLQSTGSTGLADALAILGYNSAHVILPSYFDEYDAVIDSTVAVRYKQLDRLYPGSQFILTIRRDTESWLKSYQRHIAGEDLNKYTTEWRDEILYYSPLLFGSVQYDEDLCRASYFRHIREVKSYFQHRQGDLLEIDIPSGEGWEKLCPFLGKPIPNEPFPWLNQGDLSKRRFQSRAAKYDLATGKLIRFDAVK